MISRSTLIGALVVVELGIAGMAVRAVAGDSAAPTGPPAPAQPGHHHNHFGASVTVPPKLDRSFALGATPHVVLDVHDVDVVVDAGSQPVVRAVESTSVSGYVHGSVPALAAETGPGEVRIASSNEGGVHVVFGELSRKLRVTVPAGAQVEIISAGRIDASGLRAKLVAHSPDGSLHVRNHRGDVDLSTDSGRIELVDVQGADIAANTHDGRLYFTRVGAERMNGHTNSGRIYAVDLRVKDGALSTNSGRIAASFTGTSDAKITAKTGDGKIVVEGLPSAEADGDARSVQLGAGSGHFEISTDDGGVTISRGANV
jgi:DUF4097 and DUF4098 domain-containing protein YvlB